MTNARLKNVFSLSSKVTVYVPATININEEIDNSKYVDKAATLLSDCFGGATSTDALGYWTSPTVGLVKEKTTMVFAYASEKDFTQAIFDASLKAGVSLRVVKKAYAAPDHPELMGVDETKYLKFFIFQVV